jgi:FtsZ-binding cell division protein ZapB
MQDLEFDEIPQEKKQSNGRTREHLDSDNEPIKQVREEFRQRLRASDPDEELDIDMEASDLQI